MEMKKKSHECTSWDFHDKAYFFVPDLEMEMTFVVLGCKQVPSLIAMYHLLATVRLSVTQK